jgi:hypothetical protein
VFVRVYALTSSHVPSETLDLFVTQTRREPNRADFVLLEVPRGRRRRLLLAKHCDESASALGLSPILSGSTLRSKAAILLAPIQSQPPNHTAPALFDPADARRAGRQLRAQFPNRFQSSLMTALAALIQLGICSHSIHPSLRHEADTL